MHRTLIAPDGVAELGSTWLPRLLILLLEKVLLRLLVVLLRLLVARWMLVVLLEEILLLEGALLLILVLLLLRLLPTSVRVLLFLETTMDGTVREEVARVVAPLLVEVLLAELFVEKLLVQLGVETLLPVLLETVVIGARRVGGTGCVGAG